MSLTIPNNWPKTIPDLCEILGIDSCIGPRLTCHAQTKQKRRCKRVISAANSSRVSSLLGEIVDLGSRETSRPFLEQLSLLIMCKINHCSEAPVRLSTWEDALKIFRSGINVGQKVETPSLAMKPVISISDTPQSHIKNDANSRVLDTTDSQVFPPASPRRTRQNKTSPSKDISTKHEFKPFGPPRTTTSTNKAIQQLILRPLLQTETTPEGFLYLYTLPSEYRTAAPYLKIGYTNNIVSRMASWTRQCGYTPMLLVSFKADWHVKVEKLVHMQLYSKRKTEKCPTCSAQHKEWFDVSSSEASRIVGLWTAWTRQQPYDEEGNLKKKWMERAELVDLADPDCWETFVNPRDEEEYETELSEEDSFQWSDDGQSQDSDENENEFYGEDDELEEQRK